MALEDLERLVQKETYKIVVVNGHPPLLNNLAERLKKKGYLVEEVDGPEFDPSFEKIYASKVKGKKPMNKLGIIEGLGMIKDVVKKGEQFVDDLISKSPNFIVLNYKKPEEMGIIYTAAAYKILSERILNLCATAIGAPKDDLLLKKIDTARALKLLTYNFDDFITEFHWNNCDPAFTITPACTQVNNLLGTIIKAEPEQLEKYVQELKKRVEEAYTEVKKIESIYMGTKKAPMLSELEFRLNGVYSIIYQRELKIEEFEGIKETASKLESYKRGSVARQGGDIVETLKKSFDNLQGAESLEAQYYGLPIKYNIVMLIADKGVYRVFFTNVDAVQHDTEERRQSSVDISVHEEAGPIKIGTESNYIQDMQRRGIGVLKISDKTPNQLGFEKKQIWGAAQYAILQKTFTTGLFQKFAKRYFFSLPTPSSFTHTSSSNN